MNPILWFIFGACASPMAIAGAFCAFYVWERENSRRRDREWALHDRAYRREMALRTRRLRFLADDEPEPDPDPDPEDAV